MSEHEMVGHQVHEHDQTDCVSLQTQNEVNYQSQLLVIFLLISFEQYLDHLVKVYHHLYFAKILESYFSRIDNADD